jgi:hypothetical protein
MSIQVSNHEDAVEQEAVGKRQLEVEVGEHLTDTPHRIKILWGEHPREDNPICEYRFATEAELNAFLLGAEAAEGWMGFTIID